MNKLIEKLWSETPIIAKKIQLIAGTISASCIAVATYYSNLSDPVINLLPLPIVKGIATIGILTMIIAQTKTVKK